MQSATSEVVAGFPLLHVPHPVSMMLTILRTTVPVDPKRPLTIESDGQRIVATNFWDTPRAHRGAVFCSVNAGAVRLLLPQVCEHHVNEMVGREVIVTRGLWHAMGGQEALELMWEDNSDAPWSVCIGQGQFDRLINRADAGRKIACLVYVRGFNGTPLLAGSWPARFRVATSLPCLRPWGE